jgi:N-methylhydantoinase A/oxoprolinase/acetone carboxylase beta subunit
VHEGLIFGGETLTATDLIVAAGEAEVGDVSAVSHLSKEVIQQGKTTMQDILDRGIDMMKLSSEPMPVILVGGGSLLVSGDLQSASEVVRPKHAEVANAIGASIAQISGESEKMVSYQAQSREEAISQVTQDATQNAVNAGADLHSIKVAEVEETAIPYMDGASTKIRIKVMGDVAALSNQVQR